MQKMWWFVGGQKGKMNFISEAKFRQVVKEIIAQETKTLRNEVKILREISNSHQDRVKVLETQIEEISKNLPKTMKDLFELYGEVNYQPLK